MDVLAANQDGVPEMSAEGAAACIDCGHCLAVCPTGALSLGSVAPEACQPLTAGAPDWDAIEQLVKGRRSVRRYREELVPRATLARLLDMVRWAPTAVNRQPVRWTMVSGRDRVRQLSAMVFEWAKQQPGLQDYVASWDDGDTRALRDAPHLAIAYSPTEAFGNGCDAIIAATTLELAASAAGVGACWAGFFMGAARTDAPLQALIELPEGHTVYAALMMGFPEFAYHRIPPRAEAEPTWLG
jgi:nitroreductase